ncbi:non-ribosomal peptide synthetase [Brevibacillus brevis]|uniref:Amino acid adenylation domain-containing protein n=1 Tax=Brevibacillus brevis TaxID=1393 RepID=A0A517I4L2_BREBE|nr:non-ribosomal peptide synthetase [Brevibacillus brevis]QDS33833.1 amino acid adenylation domain-containing protein [Brevibacillus brevis]
MNGVQIKNIYRLTPMQEGMLYHFILHPESEVHFEQTVITMEESLRLDLFDQSFRDLVERFDILRTVFHYKESKKPLQIVLKQREAAIHIEDISDLTQAEQEVFVEQFLVRDRRNRFDLEKDLLFRITVMKLSESKFKMVWSFHHIIMDGWCLGIVAKDFFHIYRSYLQNKKAELAPPYSFSSYVTWLGKQNKQEGLSFWRDSLDGFDQQSPLPVEYISTGKGYQRESIVFRMDRETTARLEQIARSNDVTLSIVFHSLWGLLLQRYNYANDVVFGSVVSGRPSELVGVEEMVGLFVNTIPMRIRSEGKQTFSELLRQVQQFFTATSSYQYLSLADIQSETALKQNLIQHLMVFENYPLTEEAFDEDGKGGLFGITDVQGYEQTSYDFNLCIIPGKELEIHFIYNALAYSDAYLQKVQTHLNQLIQSVIRNPDLPIAKMQMVTEEEQALILQQWNDTEMLVDQALTIDQLFKEQVKKGPDHIAVVDQTGTYTYQELDDKSDALAHVLREKGVQPGSIVAVMVERSTAYSLAILAVLKAGGAFLPISTDHPSERISYMIEDSGASIVFVHDPTISYAERILPEATLINLDDTSVYNDVSRDVQTLHRSSDLAYVIYTSGSTGKPKGVRLHHVGIANLQQFFINGLGITQEDKVLQFASISFDASVWEFTMGVLTGARLVIVSKDVVLDPQAFSEYLLRHEVTVATLPPTFVTYLEPENFPKLKTLITAGSAANWELVHKWSAHCRYINAYGPTETTICATTWTYEGQESLPQQVPIGKPIANTKVYVLDAHGHLQPEGIPGELAIAGISVADGYINREELTNEKFVADPFIAGSRLYKTGDMVKWLADGSLEYLGRMDNQVKIRGFRIELDEVENVILSQTGVKEAVVLAKKEQGGDACLIAYLVWEQPDWNRDLRQELLATLPAYMVPTYIHVLERMPITPNGKIDRKALPEPAMIREASKQLNPPVTEQEIRLAEIWKEVLDLQEISVDDHFYDLGGHSIKAIQLVARLHKEGIEVKIQTIFQYDTVRALAGYLDTVNRMRTTKAQDKKELETLIYAHFQVRSTYVEVPFGSKHRAVLYVEENARDKHQEILSLLRKSCDPAIQPHAIQYLDFSQKAWEKERNHIQEAALDENESLPWQERLVNDLDQMLLRYSEAIVKQQTFIRQPLSPSQRYHVQEKDISGTVIRFERMIDPKTLEKAFLDVLERHHLLRCTLAFEEEEPYWKEYRCPSEIALPVVDVSGDSDDRKEAVRQILLSEYFYKQHDSIGSLSYKVILLKESEKEYSFLFPASHLIFDFISSEVLQNDMNLYYEALENGTDLSENDRNTYWDFVQQITKGPIGIEDQQLMEEFDLHAFENSLLSIERQLASSSALDGYTIVTCELDMDNPQETENARIPIALLARFCERSYGVQKAPIFLMNFGRSFMGNHFFDVLGECIDHIPLHIDPASSLDELETYVKARLDLAKERNIHFTNLVQNPDVTENYSISNHSLIQSMQMTPIICNFLGEQNKSQPSEYDHLFIKGKKRILFEASYTSMGKMTIFMALPYREDERKLRVILEQEAKKLIGSPLVIR